MLIETIKINGIYIALNMNNPYNRLWLADSKPIIIDYMVQGVKKMKTIYHLSRKEMQQKILIHAPGLTSDERTTLLNLVADLPARLLNDVLSALKEIKKGQIKS